MKKFIHRPEALVSELWESFALSRPDKIRLAGGSLVARAKPKSAGKAGVVTLEGSGHEPGLSGFVGQGHARRQRTGRDFAAPGAPRSLEAVRLAGPPHGVA